MYVLARSGLIVHPAGAISGLLRICYWTTLAFAGFRACAIAGRVGRVAVTPGARRLRAAALLIGIGLGLAAVQNLVCRPGATAVPGVTADLSTQMLTV
jgi:hypothetical protein